MTDLKGKKVFVGLSGGVDSSVTAALLKEAGALVHGVFIQGWYPPYLSCTWREDRADAMRVAAHLGIPFATFDAAEEYKKFVIDYLLSEYKAGRTPNPDIMCNREVKFGAFYRYALTHGADYVATGHYAQNKNGMIARGIDADKDQSYFLWAVPSAQLQHILFPLGAFTKAKVRELAEKYTLPTAAKKDSQGICFLGTVSIDEFLAHEFSIEKGKSFTQDGTYVGEHHGAMLYTLGEKIALEGASSGPWYVVAKDIEKNTVIVAHAAEPQRSPGTIALSSVNYFAHIDTKKKYTAQYRYHGPRIEISVNQDTNSCALLTALREPIAKGQSLVIYDGDVVVGGGIIET
jgi:tRNA-uridine 2-sulfurtransferase